MTLDDQSLREHLDRRAAAGVTDVEQIAEVVMTRVAATGSGPWWRRVGVRAPSLGIAAAAIVVVVVALAVLPPRLWPGPGTSASPSVSPAINGYPIDRALTVKELDAVLGSDPAARAGEIVIANVTLEALDVRCLGTACPRYIADLERRSIGVHDPGAAEPELPGSSVLQVRPDGSLDLLGYARSGPDGLAWTLPQVTAELPNLHGPGARPVPYLYLVDGWRAVSTNAYRCLAAPSTDFGCGEGVAWLVADEASLPTDFNSAPNGSLRVSNVTGVRVRSDGLQQHGYWLVDPFVPQEDCFLCPPAGAADLLGPILTLDELAFTPSETSGPSAAHPYPADQALNVLELGAVLGPDPGARAGLTVIADVTLEPVFGLCAGECPRYYAVLEDRRIPVYDPGGADPDLAGTVALRAREDGGLDLLGLVRAGPDGLAWRFPDALYELIPLRGPGIDPVLYLYLVDGWQAVSPFQPTCAPASGDPRFSCGDNGAWLVPDEATARDLSTGSVSTPAAGIRVPNGGEGGTTGAGFWLIDPWVDQSGCSGCTPAGAADLLGRVLTLEELGVLP